MTQYEEFLKAKQITAPTTGIEKDFALNEKLFRFQRAIVAWALKRGRGAIFANTGLGKTPMQVEWAKHVEEHIKRPVLILAPLAVAHQTVAMSKELLGADVLYTRSQSDVKERGIYITNYQMLHAFDASAFGGVVCDESSLLKSSDGKTRMLLQEEFKETPFKLCCTATPAPNDYMELGTHAEFLGVMSQSEMLSTFFVLDGGETQTWRLKGHAETAFWKWLASWAVCIQHPRDIGMDEPGYDLPKLRIHEVIVDSDAAPLDGELFAMEARTLQERRQARKHSIGDRVAKCSEIANSLNGSQVFAWCNLNTESEETAKAINAVEVTGSDTDDHKETSILGFAHGDIKRMVSKPSICGAGINLQKCHYVFYVGLSDSWEALYQSIRRFWRFGQQHPVDVWIVISSLEGAVLQNIKRKEADAMRMQQALVEHMAGFTKRELKGTTRMKSEYKRDTRKGDNWEMRLGDCVEETKTLESDSVGFTLYSPPFSSMYVYSASDRDMGNSRDEQQFHRHFVFLLEELFRVTMPGRMMSFHCMNLPTSKTHHGYIGIRDFRGALIAASIEAGFIYHSEVCIWKDPVTAMQRTKAIGLLHKQMVKDSCMSRQGLPDYLVTMRKPGTNPEPVDGELDRWIGDDSFKSQGRLSIDLWQRYASPVWMDINPSRTLQKDSARENADERHVCPLQLDVIERAMELWSNPGDLVLSPFAGIGSEGYVAVESGRRFIGAELKESYFRQACSNLESAEAKLREEVLL